VISMSLVGLPVSDRRQPEPGHELQLEVVVHRGESIPSLIPSDHARSGALIPSRRPALDASAERIEVTGTAQVQLGTVLDDERGFASDMNPSTLVTVSL